MATPEPSHTSQSHASLSVSAPQSTSHSDILSATESDIDRPPESSTQPVTESDILSAQRSSTQPAQSSTQPVTESDILSAQRSSTQPVSKVAHSLPKVAHSLLPKVTYYMLLKVTHSLLLQKKYHWQSQVFPKGSSGYYDSYSLPGYIKPLSHHSYRLRCNLKALHLKP